jgi:nickel-type superoxide dismutase maturation protease
MNDGASQYSSGGPVVFSSVPELTLGKFLLWCVGRLKRFRIRGESMNPTLDEGQEVLVRPSTANSLPQPGQLILVRHPMTTEVTMIKRCSHIENDLVFVHGDNSAASTDSRQFGGVKAELVLGYVQCTFP